MAPEDTALPQEQPEGTAASPPATEVPAGQPSLAFSRWEIAAYVVLVLGAAGLRFWDLGLRPIHYDESIHGMYSWHLARGDGYQHDPLLHGPFKVLGTSFFYILFGVSDYTTRILPALFGSLVVAIPMLYRRYLGRWGSLAVALMLAFSPALLYFSRFNRDDIFAVGWDLLLVWCLWRYMEQPQRRYLFLAAAVLGLSFASMESTFISLVIFGLFLLVISARSLGRALRHKLDFSRLPPPGVFLLLLLTLALPQGAAALAWLQGRLGVVLANIDSTKGLEGIPLGTGLWVAIGFVAFLLAISIAIGLRWNWRRWLICASIFYAIYVVFFTTFFTNLLGFASGTWRSFGYWFIVQQPKHRMDQPWFYYMMEMSIYEFLPLILAAIGGIYYLVRRNLFTTFLIYWAVAALVLYSYAGEKAPWLVLHVVLPLILIAGKFLGEMLEHNKALPRVLLAAGFVLLLLVSGYRAVQSTFQRSDSPPLLLVYAQVSFEAPPILEKIEEQAARTSEGKSIPIAVDSDLAWPLMWYFRDYKSMSYPKVDEKALAGDYQVVLVSSEHNASMLPYADRYEPGQRFNVLTWFPEDYRRFKPREVFSASLWKEWWNYAVYRKTSQVWKSEALAYFAKVPAGQAQ